MKKRIIFDLIALLAIAVGFFALFYFRDPDAYLLQELKDTDIKTLVDKALVENGGYVQKQELVEDMPDISVKETFVQPSVEELKNCYYYSVLNEEEKIVYGEIYNSVKNMEENSELSTVDAQLVEKIFKCVLNDHPEFYLEPLPLPAPFSKNESGTLALIPGEYDTDGFFISRLRRKL